jgi:phosphoribosylglycinamide formyltransferase-1
VDDRFIDEEIVPVKGAIAARPAPPGEPLLPARFEWRGEQIAVGGVIHTWKTTGPCRSGSDEQYVRRHWYRVRTTDGREVTIYFERQPPRPRSRAGRWRLHSLAERRTQT